MPKQWLLINFKNLFQFKELFRAPVGNLMKSLGNYKSIGVEHDKRYSEIVEVAVRNRLLGNVKWVNFKA